MVEFQSDLVEGRNRMTILAMTMLRVILALLLTFHNSAAQCSTSQPVQVSMLQLIATPERYDGKTIRVTAFLHLEFEGNALYLHREDYENALVSNSIAIEFTDTEAMTSKKYQNSYVLMEGRFSATTRGHFGAGQGSLSQITRLIGWKVRRK